MTFSAARPQARIQKVVLWLLLAWFAYLSLGVLETLKVQPAGVDFSAVWAGAKTALHAPERLYDFHYVTELQGWPLGPSRLRPYVYPPSALLAFLPFTAFSSAAAYGVWTLATFIFFAWAAVRAGAPKWFVLTPWVAFAAFSGQATFLLGGLVLLGLALAERQLLAGVLFGIAAAIKPQILILLPLALIAENRWRTIIATGATGLLLCAASATIWGLNPWLQWFAALPRFEELVSHVPRLVVNAITPYAALTHYDYDGRWSLLLAPLAVLWVWFAFRRRADMADRLIALFGGAFLISPYAMNYELALFAPAIGIYLARTDDRRWPGFAAAGVGQALVLHPAFFSLATILSLPLQRCLARWGLARLEPAASLKTNP